MIDINKKDGTLGIFVENLRPIVIGIHSETLQNGQWISLNGDVFLRIVLILVLVLGLK